MRTILVGIALLATIAAAHAFGLGLGTRFGKMGGMGWAGGVPTPPVTGDILRIDSVSHILRIDGTSKICRIGGC